jgi:hypothetical protein
VPGILVRILNAVFAYLLENFLQIANRLISDRHEVLNVVVLMLLKCIEEHVHHSCLVCTRLLAIGLLLSLVFDLKRNIL